MHFLKGIIRLIIDTKMALKGADNDNDHYLVVAKSVKDCNKYANHSQKAKQ